jgi:DeoR/GlpR family transcriptional regulator of sugar metabolism
MYHGVLWRFKWNSEVNRLLPAVRKNKIKQLVLEKKDVTVAELANAFSVSEETIRRDLKLLEDSGFIERTHGGAVLAERVLSSVSSKDLKNVFVESKRVISSLVRPLIKKGDCIFLDSSTTSYYVSDELKDLQLTIATNSLDILSNMSNRSNINLIAIGGTFLQKRRCFVGRNTLKILQDTYFDIVLFSCRTLSLDYGITDSNDDEAEIKRVAGERTKRLILMADHSKFNKASFTKICDLSKISDLITDRPLEREWLEYLSAHNIGYFDTTQQQEDCDVK